ncbi:Kinesin-like protein kif15 [Coemansia thaxteri]|uniref:Kinesin-like protein n=1 Tax=Coemansia thaxteri TaxID=2663907 RepID=A0A9W8BKJ2_9FUNG|nr:Kinesin-like protein kif15 [Coemansia thaxteri]KAJ2007047.1 Kinesin-like protein kif15 [Coemansia thaxteri]KAJ2472967.1 Kinesin-like protein kif15 [Coemansia sp. RSA 2322]KAJ2487866.1 Kinesin-like protein kif15 [Coemansia sp. RSA 2320]
MDNIQVFMRIRPLSEDEYKRDRTTESAVRMLTNNTVSIPSQRTENFTFDFVGTEDCAQEEVFEAVGKRAVEQCMQGYNGTIFAYGQTGSGKTFTMQGARDEFTGPDDELRGLIPRCFEYLFARIAEEESRFSGRVKYLCKASYIEIYNETIFDLLDPLIRTCALREDIKKGIFIDNVTEETVQDPNEAYSVFVRGTTSRHVSATSMNRESSRSHSVLMLVIQSLTQMDTGLTEIRESKFNLVDLAGSERQKLANTSGMRLKEAANINKSLSTLGNVINSLVDIGNGRTRHVNYRDSKLTFLLRDSLGGNSVTFIIANVSPALCNDAETASTLRFAQRAKMIRNKAVVNQDMQGNVPQLQAEIQRLKQQIAHMRVGGPAAFDSGFESTLAGSSDYTVSPYSEPTSSSLDNTAGGVVVGSVGGGLSNKEHRTTQFLLILAMRKLQESERQKGRYVEIIFELKDSLDRHRRQLQQQKLVLKLAKVEKDSLRRNAPLSYVVTAENSALREEITALQMALSAQPDPVDLIIENMHLQDMLEAARTREPVSLTLPDRDDALEALETLLGTKASFVDLKSVFPIIADDAVYSGLEDKIKQARHDINDLEVQKDRLEFQIKSIEEDWQNVNEGTHRLSTATTDEQIDSIVEQTMDGIVGYQARDTWSAISSLFTRTF